MADATWSWKGKDGSQGKLLYEPGNWGDLLKLVCLSEYCTWVLEQSGLSVARYLDPFAGAPSYPLGEKALYRCSQARLAALSCIRDAFLARGLWPSTSSIARLLIDGEVAVFDANPERQALWLANKDVKVCEGESGWEIVKQEKPQADALWLIDPYDIVSEWREHLSLLLEKAGYVTMFIYVYNRAAKDGNAFAEYRRFRNALDDGTAGLTKRVARIASDAFLPRAHHELIFLPTRSLAADPAFPGLLERLEYAVIGLNKAQGRAAVFDI